MATASTIGPSGATPFSSLLSGLPINAGANATNNPTLLSEGGTGGLLGMLFGQTPGVANPVSSAKTATQGDIGNLPGIANLTQGTDIISNAAAPTGLEANLPGYEGMLGSATGDTAQELQGQVPQDVWNQIQQGAAERGVASGQGPGSPNENASMLQTLGLTSLGEEQTGMSNLGQLIGETPQGAQFDPASMFVTPQNEQSAAQGVQNAMASPDPGASGALSSIMSCI